MRQTLRRTRYLFGRVAKTTQALGSIGTIFIWNGSIGNNQNCYKSDMNLTVDEQLFSTKVRCKFTHNFTLTIYKPKPSGKVAIFSLKHKSLKINNDRKRVLETVAYYNKAKYGHDLCKFLSTFFSRPVLMYESFIRKQVDKIYPDNNF
ncbi:piggyBac transposable element-derived protein 4-like [Vespula maculifrons]|uniref:PiggyBac transposable element-derived protein 4-like n=1 Tax=Vespula maculifrons TaxID=7453 RepID=A0ABD2CBE3_VESMC